MHDACSAHVVHKLVSPDKTSAAGQPPDLSVLVAIYWCLSKQTLFIKSIINCLTSRTQLVRSGVECGGVRVFPRSISMTKT